jgi:nucleotide-binding universal stress UspA family protein
MGWLPREKVLVPVDFSEESLRAVEVALQIVEDPSELHVIHVLPPLAANDPAVLWDVVSEETATKRAQERMEELFGGPRYAGHVDAVSFGAPAAEIASYADEIGADLIVLPSHGRTGMKRLLIGSVAERVVRHAHCPVLVLRD